MAIFSDYVTKTVPFLGGTVALKVRALSVKESPEFVAGVKAAQERWAATADRRKDESDEAYAERLSAVQHELDQYIYGVMGRTVQTKNGPKGYYVRLVEPLENEDDGTKIEDCVALAQRGGLLFRMAVMAEISSLADVDRYLGNSSGSPSTSTVATGQSISASPATSTPTCETPSTATVTPIVSVPSSPAA